MNRYEELLNEVNKIIVRIRLIIIIRSQYYEHRL